MNSIVKHCLFIETQGGAPEIRLVNCSRASVKSVRLSKIFINKSFFVVFFLSTSGA